MKIILPVMGVMLALTLIFGTQAQADKMGYALIGALMACGAEWVWKMTEPMKENKHD